MLDLKEAEAAAKKRRKEEERLAAKAAKYETKMLEKRSAENKETEKYYKVLLLFE